MCARDTHVVARKPIQPVSICQYMSPHRQVSVSGRPPKRGFLMKTARPRTLGTLAESRRRAHTTPDDRNTPVAAEQPGCNAFDVTDDELTDDWEAGTVFPGGISHLQHLRIAWVLHRRHGAEETRPRLLDGTKWACDAHDPSLNDHRWARAISDAIEHDGPQATADHFLAADPDLQRGGFLGRALPQQPSLNGRQLAEHASLPGRARTA